MNKIVLGGQEFTVERCGIIPYCKINDNEYKILLGLKSNYGKYYGDLGGGIKNKETYLDGLIREIFEESSTLIFPNSIAIINGLFKSKVIIHQTNNRFAKTIFMEYLIPVPFSKNYTTHFLDHDITEHVELRWFDVKEVNGKFTIVNFNIKEELDGGLKSLISQILSSLKMI